MIQTFQFARMMLRAFTTILIGFTVSAIIVIVITFLGYRADNQQVTDRIKQDLSTGAVSMPPTFNVDTQTGIDTWTDCLTLMIATSGYSDVANALTSAYFFGWKENHPCEYLLTKVGPLKPTEAGDYWRYWWGSASVLKIILNIDEIGLLSYQRSLELTCYVLILLVGITAFIRYRRAALRLLPVVVALILGFGLPVLGQSVAHAPGLIIGMLLLLLYMATGLDKAGVRWQFIYFFNVGGIAVYFDLMDGNLPATLLCFALVKVLSIRAFGSPKSLWPVGLRLWPISTAIVLLMIAFFMGAVSIAFLRVLLRSVVLEQNITAVIEEWLKPLSVHTIYNFANWNENWSERAGFYNRLNVAGYPYIGRHATLLIYAVCGVVYLIIVRWLARNARKLEADQRDTCLGVSLIVSIVPLWYCVFPRHTAINFQLTGRLLSLFFALALSMAVFVMEFSRTQSIRQSPR